LKRRWSSTLDNLKLNIDINVFLTADIGYFVLKSFGLVRDVAVIMCYFSLLFFVVVVHFRSSCYAAVSGE